MSKELCGDICNGKTYEKNWSWQFCGIAADISHPENMDDTKWHWLEGIRFPIQNKYSDIIV